MNITMNFLGKSRTLYALMMSAVLGLSACGEVAKDVPTSGSGGSSSYTVGGTVFSLTDPGLVLKNGADSVVLASGASSYTFPASVAKGNTYSVSIVQAPIGFTVSCAVVNATGMMGSSNVTNVNVSCSASNPTVTTVSMPGVGSVAPLPGLVNAASLDASSFSNPVDIVLDSTTNTFYILDQGNRAVRTVSSSGAVTTLYSGLSNPSSMTLAKDGNLYIYDNGSIVQLTLAGVANTIAGSTIVSGYMDAAGSLAQFDSNQTHVGSIAADAVSGNLYVADTGNNMIRMVTPLGVVSTVAGTLLPGAASASTSTSLATFDRPQGIAVDRSGNVYVGDTNNHVIRQILSSGTTVVLAGTGAATSIDMNLGTTSSVIDFSNFALDSASNLYFTEPSTGTIRKLNILTVNASSGVSTIVGGIPGFVNGAQSKARLNPSGLTIDGLGRAWVADGVNNAIRLVSP